MSVACVELGCQDASYWFPLPTKSIEIWLAHKLYWRKYSGHSPIGESHKGVLAKLQWTFANWRKSWGYIGESTVDIRQWRKSYWRKSYWRKSGKPFFYLYVFLSSLFIIRREDTSCVAVCGCEVNIFTHPHTLITLANRCCQLLIDSLNCFLYKVDGRTNITKTKDAGMNEIK
jgi:hypothetical protein